MAVGCAQECCIFIAQVTRMFKPFCNFMVTTTIQLDNNKIIQFGWSHHGKMSQVLKCGYVCVCVGVCCVAEKIVPSTFAPFRMEFHQNESVTSNNFWNIKMKFLFNRKKMIYSDCFFFLFFLCVYFIYARITRISVIVKLCSYCYWNESIKLWKRAI